MELNNILLELDIDSIMLLSNHLHETLFLTMGAVLALFVMYLRDYRLSEHAGKGYFWYLFQADRKKTDDVIVILCTLICAEIVTGALTGLSPQQLIIAGIGLGVATNVRAGGENQDKGK